MAKFIEKVKKSKKSEALSIKKIDNGYLAVIDEKELAFVGENALDELKSAIAGELTEEA